MHPFATKVCLSISNERTQWAAPGRMGRIEGNCSTTAAFVLNAPLPVPVVCLRALKGVIMHTLFHYGRAVVFHEGKSLVYYNGFHGKSQ